MGSFKHAAQRRATDVRTITAEDRPDGVAVEDWLGSGESITFWTKLPHGVSTRMVAAATSVIYDPRTGQTSGGYDAGRAIAARMAEGIISWQLFDGDGIEVPWVAARADALLDGLPDPVHQYLVRNIGGLAPKPATAQVDDEDESAGTVGEASAATSSPS